MEIKWIKITTDIFDDEKILLIEDFPEADSIIVIWFKLLTFAGKSNNNGVFMMNNKIPYTDEMLSTIFRRSLVKVRLALQVFENFGMIEVIDNVITVPNWEKHQNVDGMEKIREQTRERVSKHREKQKLLLECNVTETLRNALDKDKDKEEDKEKEKEKDKEKRENINYQQIADMYNNTCVSFPMIKSLSDNRKKAIRARLKKYSLADLQVVFEKAEQSNFLKGNNNRNWNATFDWIINDTNMTKIFDGNYDNEKSNSNSKQNNKEDAFSMIQRMQQEGVFDE